MFIFMTVGLTTIVTESRLLQALRNLVGKLGYWANYWISCPMCFGFWVGTGLSFISIFGVPFWAGGCIGSAMSYLYHCLTKYLNPED